MTPAARIFYQDRLNCKLREYARERRHPCLQFRNASNVISDGSYIVSTDHLENVK
jgi:hypothetical protein